jgi:ATP-grasp domain
MTPNILLITTRRWFATARLGSALAQAGCHVQAMCPSDHLLTSARGVQGTYRYSGLLPIQSVRAAMEAAQPDLVIPCDDLALEHLHHLHAMGTRSDAASSKIMDLLERSLGNFAYFSTVDSRTAFMELAREEGVRAPRTAVVTSPNQAASWLKQNGLPAVLKVDGTYGGAGTEIVDTFDAAESSFRKLNVGLLMLRMAKRTLLGRDLTVARSWFQNAKSVVNIQSFVPGPDASSSVLCWQGEVLAMIQFEVLRKTYPKGSASVLRLIDNPEISATVKRMVSRLGLSGFVGFDFILEAETGHAHLIELNPRATQTCHLRLGEGRDLVASLRSKISGETLRGAPAVTDTSVIALFPQEWQRDPDSEFIKSAYHDVPWEEPELVRAGTQYRPQKAGWLSHHRWREARSKLSVRRA